MSLDASASGRHPVTTVPLTKRAGDWLATLYHETPMSTRDVERLIVDAGHTAHPAWLEFHDAYAGFYEEVGPGDIAIWGLSRALEAEPKSYWTDQNTVWVTPSDGRMSETIVCAEAHPVHDYLLTAAGSFLGIGGPVDSFDRKIERHGLLADLYRRGKVKRTLSKQPNPTLDNEALLREMADGYVEEASDKRLEFYAEPQRVLQHSPKHDYVILFELGKV